MAKVEVYTLTLGPNHDFFVGTSRVLVHNCDINLSFSGKQLQEKFKHAGDFGVDGNYNLANRLRFQQAIEQHVADTTDLVLHGTYRGNQAIFVVDGKTGLTVILDPSGGFISGWKLGQEQLANVLFRGKL